MEDKYHELEKLNQLKENGTITETEFEVEKYKILNSKSNTTQTKKIKSKIFFILAGIGIIITIVISILTSQSYKEYWNNWEINSNVYQRLENRWETYKVGTIISIIVTDVLIFIGSIIQFVKGNKDKKNIIKLIIGIVAIIIFTVSCIFLARLN